MNEEQQTTERREVVEQNGNATVERETLRQDTRVSGRTVAVRIVWFIVGFIVALLLIRMALLLLGANQGNAFVDIVYGLSGIFAMPFYGIFNYTPAYGNSVFEVSSLVAVVIYLLIGWGIAKALTLTAARPVA
jgi:hypothetical protein